ncbi:hypothetical protein [Yinghuangia sp. YIM S09857]|uniref:hypothetical protein n=1 Tax=Yinghuangia sp. YIM S09857 TaxID=3436929 RepID=UPI003F532A18
MGGVSGGTAVARVVAPRQAPGAKAVGKTVGAKVTGAQVTTAVVSRAVARHRARPIPRQALGAARLLAAGRIAVGVVQAVAPHAAGRLLPARPAGVGDASALSRGLGVRDTVVAAGWWHALDRGGKGAAEWAWLQVAADVSDGAGTVGRWRALDRREKAWMVVLGALVVADAAVAVALGGVDEESAGTLL